MTSDMELEIWIMAFNHWNVNQHYKVKILCRAIKISGAIYKPRNFPVTTVALEFPLDKDSMLDTYEQILVWFAEKPGFVVYPKKCCCLNL
jgi:hypothetical protein